MKMTNVQSKPNARMTKTVYNLEERTIQFSQQLIDFCRKLPQDIVTKPMISQLIRSATSIGANYCEADEASSKKDFINKISIAKKESRETRHWLRLLAYAIPESKEQLRVLWKEAQELNLIFAAIIRSARSKQNSSL